MSQPPLGAMRALVLDRPGSLTLGRVPIPSPGPGEVLVRVRAATTCGTDLKAFVRGHPQIPMPGVFGHEYSGVVEAVGEGAPFEVGDAVMGVHSAPCRQCLWCVNGQENLCESIMATKVLGSFAELLLVPERIARLNVFQKPDGLSFELASLLEPLSCVAQGIELMPNPAGCRALVIGPGAIGLMFVGVLRHLGCASVTLAGRNAARLEIGAALGAEIAQWTLPPAAELAGFDLVVECTGSVDVWAGAVDCARRGGTVVLFGGCPTGTSVSFDTRRLHYDQISLVSPFHFGTRAVATAKGWLTESKMDLGCLLSGDRALEDGERTFEDLKAGRGVKYVFRP